MSKVARPKHGANPRPGPIVQYREILDAIKCTMPGCDCGGGKEGIFLNPSCHITSGTVSFYKRGVLYVSCAECGNLVTEIAVASLANEKEVRVFDA